jgi:toxin ParE1/3/4
LRIIGFERRITIAFVVEPERVVILRLFYAGRDWENLLT